MKVDIKNFQSIQQASLNLDGFSVISGNSDLGKSAVRRAITVALFNDWSKSYIRNGTNETSVSLQSKNINVSFKKSSSKNEFIVNGKHIPKIGKDKPEIPNIRQDLNVTTQLEPLFMVSYKDTENTKILNNIFGIDVLEQAQSLCSTDLRRAKMSLNSISEEESEISKELDSLEKEYYIKKEGYELARDLYECVEMLSEFLSNIDKISIYTSKLEKINKEYKEINKKISTIKNTRLINNWIKIDSDIDNSNKHKNITIETINKTKESIKKVSEFSLIKDYNHTINSFRVSNDKIKQLGVLLNNIKSNSSKLKQFGNLKNFISLSERIESIKSKYKREYQVSEIENKINILKGLSHISVYLNNLNELYNLRNNISTLSNKIESVVKEMDQYKCPSCGRFLQEDNCG